MFQVDDLPVTMNPDDKQTSDDDSVTLHECVRNGDLKALERKLRHPELAKHVNDPDDSSQTPLHYAAKANNYAACLLLLDIGQADANARDEDGATPLHYACRKSLEDDNKEASQVIELLAERSNFPSVDNYGSTPIHTAAIRGNATALRTLLQRKQDNDSNNLVNIRDQHGCIPLHEAATYNQVRAAEVLIERGSNIFVTDHDKCTPLHLACSEGALELAQLLLDSCRKRSLKELVNSEDCDDTTALHYAVEARNLALVKELVKTGADVRCRRNKKMGGSTPLHLAATAGDKDIAEYLIRCGASVNETDARNCTALHIAAQYNCVNVVDALTKHRFVDLSKRNVDGLTPLLVAAVHGSDRILRILLNYGSDVTLTDKNERTALHLAAEHGRVESVRIILDHIKYGNIEGNTIINAVDRTGLTPLHLAAQKGDVDIIKMLLNAGCDLFVKDETEETPFLQAAEMGHTRVMAELKSRNEKVVSDEDEFSNTGLHKAAENGHLNAVQLLTQWGASKEARNDKHRTPLDVAVSKGHNEVVNFLLMEKVSPNPLDKNKTTPLHLAAKYGHSHTIERLIKGGGDVTAVDMEGRNCLDIAIENGHKNAASAILKSNVWHKALANETPNKENGKPRDTPLRKLIRNMPDVASVALTRFIYRGNDKKQGDYLECNYDYLDDSYTDYAKLREKSDLEQLQDQALPAENQNYYTTDKNWIKKNHPLSLLVNESQCEELVHHPVVLALIRHKWKAIRTLYYEYLVFYAVFVSMITSYMLASRAPYQQVTISPNDTQRSWCAKLDTQAICVPEDYKLFYQFAVYIIWIMCGIGVIVEIIQVSSQGRLYLRPVNLLDWYTYISAILITLNEEGQNECSIKKCWQWQMGAFTVFSAWFVFLLFIRRLPGLGIYVVMVVEIMKTFAKFFIVFFLFIVAFAMSFHLLIQNQEPFRTPFYSISKTWVMMLGEIDYNTIFHEEMLPFERAMFAMFYLFLMLMTIIVMNLLTGLAVDDVNLLRQKARVVKLRLQVDLALDIELAMPKDYRRQTGTVVRRDRIHLVRETGTFWEMLENVQVAIEGAMLTRSAVINAGNSLIETDMLEDPELIRLESKIMKQFQDLNKRLDQLLQDRNFACRVSERMPDEYTHSAGGTSSSPESRNQAHFGDYVNIRTAEPSTFVGECQDTSEKESGIKSGSSFGQIREAWRHLSSRGVQDAVTDVTAVRVRSKQKRSGSAGEDTDKVFLLSLADEELDTSV